MTNRVFEVSIRIEKPKDKVFEFFSKAENLEAITPDWLNFKIKTPLPIEMKKNTQIDYVIKLMKIPMKWKTDITKWDPPNKFQDSQIKGPYKTWIHTHIFEDEENATLMTDRVEYKSRGWFLEPLIDKLFVRRRIEKIFEYRQKKLEELFNL